MEVTKYKNVNEIESGLRVFVRGLGSDQGLVKYDTVENCADAYSNAEAYYESRKNDAITTIRAYALMSAKKLILGKYWNFPVNSLPNNVFPKHTEWMRFLQGLELLQELPSGGLEIKVQVRTLLTFANVKEIGELKGITVVPQKANDIEKLIPEMNRHKKGKVKDQDVALMYEKLAKEKNEGQPFNTTNELVTAYKEFMSEAPSELPTKPKATTPTTGTPKETMVFVRDIFVEEVGLEPQAKYAPAEFPSEVLGNMPTCTDDEWKQFVKKVSHAIHPDKGGTEADQAILNSFREMMKVVNEQNRTITAREQWNTDYEQWKMDEGYESDFVPESQINF